MSRQSASRPRRRARRARSGQFQSLEPRQMLASDLLITELMAENDSALADEDGDFPDWIEIYNSGAAAVNLNGWSLTDDPLNLDKWEFPAVTLDANDYLVVFASEKDRDVAGQELHTNFKLDNGGEYLALVEPDGVTIAAEFDPEFPAQVPDVSYGLNTNSQSTTLVAANANATVLVPNPGDPLPADWTNPGFDDSTWIGRSGPPAPQGIGYDTGAAELQPATSVLSSYGPLGYWRFSEVGADATAVNEGTAAGALNGTYAGNPNRTQAGPLPPTYAGFEAGNSSTQFDGSDDAVTVAASPMNNLASFSMMGWIRRGNITANRVGLWGQNDAVEFGFIDPNTLQIWTPNGGSLNVGWTLGQGTWHHIAVVGNGTNLRMYIDGALSGTGGTQTGSYGTSGSQFRIGGAGVFDATANYYTGDIDEVAIFPGVALTAQQISDYVNASLGAGGTSDFSPLIGTDIEAQMFDVNSTALIRLPFTIADSAAFDSLTLNAQFDDGFVAYLNGVEVLRVNADDPLTAGSAASATRADSLAIVPESFDISDDRGLLQVGDNVLAIHALNSALDNPDFLLRAELKAVQVTGLSDDLRYFVTPTPGGPNGIGTQDLGPVVRDVAHTPANPTAADPVLITARVAQSFAAISSVTLHYRRMYDADVTLAMLDDGSIGGDTAGDGIYTAVVPAGFVPAGEMLRYYITASDAGANNSRWPLFLQPTNSPEYLGTAIADPATTSQLPIFQWFINPTAIASSNTRTGARASVYYGGEFYDNVFVRIRGGTSAGFTKHSYKFEFNDGFHFRFDPTLPRVDEFNLNSTYTDKAYMRIPLSMETYTAAGSPGSVAHLWRVEQNGNFFSTAFFLEQVDRDFLRRNDLDDNGALYKSYNSFETGSANVEKKTRRDESNADLISFVTNTNTLAGTPLQNYLLDTLDLPRMMNYMAAVVITHQNDHPHKNYYLYRDTEGTGEWFMFPQDVDLSFGKNYIGDMGGVLSDTMYAANDSVPGRAANVKPSHPFIGAEGYREWNNNWNRLLNAIINSPVLRQMFLRRLRTVMDELLQAPGTPAQDLLLEHRVDELAAAAAADVALDKQPGRWPTWGTAQTFAQSVDILKTQYLAIRRTHLFQTHSIDNVPVPPTILLDHGAPVRAFVPSDDSLGLTWTQPVFNDSQWASGTQGVGYERSSGYQTYIGLNVDSLMDPDDNNTNNNNTCYIRLHFNVNDPAALQNLFLDMRYDDGFAAYLNGVKVAKASEPLAPLTLTWNSEAGGVRSDALAVQYLAFDITAFKNLLVAGDNVLAIHGMNRVSTDTDFLIDARLRSQVAGGYADAAGIPHAQTGNPQINFGAIDYNPVSGNQDEEYIELVNANNMAVDLSGWKLQGGVTHTFEAGTIVPANSSLFVAANVVAFRARTTGPRGGQGRVIEGNYNGHISNLGETIDLVAPDMAVISTITTPVTPSDAQLYLRIGEVMYNPAPPTPAETAAGFLNNDDFEFIELVNTSAATTLNLTGVHFGQGVEFSFAGGTLAPGQRALVVSNPAAMAARYGAGLNVVGTFQNLSGLSNGGERVKLDDADNSSIVDFTYDDVAPWYPATDGQGPSLVIIDLAEPVLSWADPASWRPSFASSGSPGSGDVAATVVGRHVFYNNSAWDGNDATANASDDGAIASDKTALLPGGAATIANYTSYNRGINGIMLDMANLAGTITAADFAFKTGNVNATNTWTVLATAPSVSIRAGAGVSGSTRVTLTWLDLTIKKQWLQVTLRANGNTGLLADDVFYFGNAIGEAGNAAGDAQVNAADELAARGNPRNIANPAPITFLFDYNRDKQVNAADQLVSRGNPTNIASRLLLITPTAAAVPAAAGLADAALVAGAFDGASDVLARRGRRR